MKDFNYNRAKIAQIFKDISHEYPIEWIIKTEDEYDYDHEDILAMKNTLNRFAENSARFKEHLEKFNSITVTEEEANTLLVIAYILQIKDRIPLGNAYPERFDFNDPWEEFMKAEAIKEQKEEIKKMRKAGKTITLKRGPKHDKRQYLYMETLKRLTPAFMTYPRKTSRKNALLLCGFLMLQAGYNEFYMAYELTKPSKEITDDEGNDWYVEISFHDYLYGRLKELYKRVTK